MTYLNLCQSGKTGHCEFSRVIFDMGHFHLFPANGNVVTLKVDDFYLPSTDPIYHLTLQKFKTRTNDGITYFGL